MVSFNTCSWQHCALRIHGYMQTHLHTHIRTIHTRCYIYVKIASNIIHAQRHRRRHTSARSLSLSLSRSFAVWLLATSGHFAIRIFISRAHSVRQQQQQQHTSKTRLSRAYCPIPTPNRKVGFFAFRVSVRLT